MNNKENKMVKKIQIKEFVNLIDMNNFLRKIDIEDFINITSISYSHNSYFIVIYRENIKLCSFCNTPLITYKENSWDDPEESCDVCNGDKSKDIEELLIVK